MANVNEETRLRAELAEARRDAKAWQMYHEACIGPAEGVVLRNRAEKALRARDEAIEEGRKALADERRATARATAAEQVVNGVAATLGCVPCREAIERALASLKGSRAALAEARGALLDRRALCVSLGRTEIDPAVVIKWLDAAVAALARAGEQAPIPEKQLSGSAGPGCGACAEESKEGMPSGSLHGAGEQEAPAAVKADAFIKKFDDTTGEVLYIQVGAAIPPPGEQGKGADALADGIALVEGRWRRKCSVLQNSHDPNLGSARVEATEVEELLRKMRALANVQPEQGKGGGEGLRERWLLEHLAAVYAHQSCTGCPHPLVAMGGNNLRASAPCGDCMDQIAAIEKLLAVLAPAQPAEHPASGGEEKP